MTGTSDSTRTAPAPPRWREGIAAALAGWLAARVAVALGYVVARLLAGSVDLPDGRLHLDEGLMTYDGTFYRLITEGWYQNPSLPEEGIRFFPAYPALGRLVSPITIGDSDMALLLIANAAAVAAGVMLWRLAVEVTGDRGIGIRAAWMIAVVPAANVFAFAYTESLMLLVVTTFLLALHRRALGWVAVLALVAGMLRPAGVLLVVPVLVEFLSDARGTRAGSDPGTASVDQGARDHRQRFGQLGAGWIAAAFAPVVGLGAAMWIVSRRTEDLGAAFNIQRELRDGFREPFTRLISALVDFTGGALHDIYNVAFAAGFAVLFVVAVRKRQPLSWLALMAVTWLVAAGANNIDSFGRYCIVASPFVIALAQWARTRAWQVAVGAVGLAGTVWYTAEVFLGRVIP